MLSVVVVVFDKHNSVNYSVSIWEPSFCMPIVCAISTILNRPSSSTIGYHFRCYRWLLSFWRRSASVLSFKLIWLPLCTVPYVQNMWNFQIICLLRFDKFALTSVKEPGLEIVSKIRQFSSISKETYKIAREINSIGSSFVYYQNNNLHTWKKTLLKWRCNEHVGFTLYKY